MKTLIIIASMLLLTGCNSLDRLLGSEDKKEDGGGFHVVAACMDNNDTGHPTFPTFLPQDHIDLIRSVRAACHANDCQINGETYLVVGADCGHGNGYIGDGYYAGRGY